MEFHCETGPTCSGTIAGGAMAISNASGETFTCTSVTGTANGTSTTKIVTIQLLFHGCIGTVSRFKFSCSNTGTAGTIAWAAFQATTYTGNIIGTFTNSPTICNTFQASHELNFTATSHGQQTDKAYPGVNYDLTSGTHSNDTVTTALIWEYKITYMGKQSQNYMLSIGI
jgi:hypothetical protein